MNTVDAGWFGAVLILGTIVTVSLWLLNRLFPQTASHLPKNPVHRTDIADESEMQHRGSVEQHR